ncbi:MAG: glycerol-3-phosphate 1-O-acyltransferase PlsY [Solobacterium sp.]|jgi:glycerol-3-phosphate acyltransferase PlsY|nr:glycerol-3-phosphate 1-O-acyltransferase PlsY [Solobacterium sp.]MCH4266280.1 glycerol-3-phosphate 1-O-acyltransferase PlsY [Solobacterium sp.]
MSILLAIVISYLFGSIPWALIIGKTFFHKDIRKEGSGNLGASNAGRVLGKPVAVIVTLLDASKAFLSMLVTLYLAPEAILYAGLACCFGHCFPIFAQFHGGKAVACSFGFFAGIAFFINHQYFWTFFWPIICFFAILYLTRMVSISSILSMLIEAVTSFFLPNTGLEVSICILVLWAFVTYRHRSNLQRIKNGTESKIKWMGALPNGKN